MSGLRINSWIFIVVFTSLTGSFAYLIWKCLERWCLKKKIYNLVWGLRYVLMGFFLFPVVYIFLIWSTVIKRGQYSEAFSVTPVILKVSFILFWIWAAGFAVQVILYILQRILMEQCRRKAVPVTEEISDMSDDIRERLGVRKKVQIFLDKRIDSPVVFREFRPVILLPEKFKDYPTKYIKISLLHEMLHLKYHDLLTKQAIQWLERIHWWNPCIYLLAKDINIWAEIHCDEAADDYSGDEFSCYDYFNLLYENAAEKKVRLSKVDMGLFERKKEVKARMRRFRWKKERKSCGVGLGLVSALIFTALSAGTAYAAGEGLLQAYGKLVENTEVFLEEDPQIRELEEEIFMPDEIEPGVKIVEMIDETSMLRDTVVLEWRVAVDTWNMTGQFSKKAGEEIRVSVNISPDDKEARVGIIEPDGVRRAVSGSGMVSHAFKVNKSGMHRVYIQNMSNVPAEVVGYYTK